MPTGSLLCWALTILSCVVLCGCNKEARGPDGPTAETCAKSDACRKLGSCGLVPGTHSCVPTKAEHCRESERCKQRGIGCEYDNHFCVLPMPPPPVKH